MGKQPQVQTEQQVPMRSPPCSNGRPVKPAKNASGNKIKEWPFARKQEQQRRGKNNPSFAKDRTGIRNQGPGKADTASPQSSTQQAIHGPWMFISHQAGQRGRGCLRQSSLQVVMQRPQEGNHVCGGPSVRVEWNQHPNTHSNSCSSCSSSTSSRQAQRPPLTASPAVPLPVVVGWGQQRAG